MTQVNLALLQQQRQTLLLVALTLDTQDQDHLLGALRMLDYVQDELKHKGHVRLIRQGPSTQED